MSKIGDLAEQVQNLTALLRQHGIIPPEQKKQEKQYDYIEHGSDKHARMIGLVEVLEGEDTEHCITYISPKSGRTWRLQDEITPFMQVPNPREIAALTLRQKVSTLDTGKPEVPEGAPPMWRPAPVF